MATWKKVLVSGSAIDGTTLNIDGAVTLTNNFSTGDSTDQVLVLNADNSVKVVNQSNIAGITTSTLRITGSDESNDVVNAANSESIVFAGDIASIISTDTDDNGSPETIITLNLPGGILSSSAQIATSISESFVSSSTAIFNTISATTASVGANETNITTLTNLQSGLLNGSSSFAISSSIIGTANEVEVLGNGSQGIQIGLPNDVHIEGDVQVTGSLIVSESLTANTLTLLGLSLIDNQTAVISGSNIFGNDETDTHAFSGSINILGQITASDVPTDANITILDLVGTSGTNGFVNAGQGVQDEISGSFYSASAAIFGVIDGITSNQASGIAINTNEATDPAFSLGVNGTASFEASGTGLTVDNSSGVVTYTINPTTLVNSVGGSNQIISSSAQLSGTFLTIQGDNVISSSEQLPDGIISSSDQLPEGIISSSDQFPDGVVSGSITSTTQGQITFPGQGTVNLQDLQTSNSPTFANLTLTGDLLVQGATTSVNVANLNVEDQFILINSGAGANTADKDGGIIVDFGGGSGSGFVYDAASKAWGVLGTDHSSNDQNIYLGFDDVSDAGNAVVPRHIVSVVSQSEFNPLNADGTSQAPTYGDSTAKSDLGNMHINNQDGAIWIYS